MINLAPMTGIFFMLQNIGTYAERATKLPIQKG